MKQRISRVRSSGLGANADHPPSARMLTGLLAALDVDCLTGRNMLCTHDRYLRVLAMRGELYLLRTVVDSSYESLNG